MAKEDRQLLAFNRGVISKRGLARIDLERMAMSASLQRNFMPRILGSMMLRPGWEFIDNTNNNQGARNLPFIFGVDDTCVIEMGNVNMKVRIDDVVITRPTVSATISNSGFTAAIGIGWTDASDTGGTASAPSGYALLGGDDTDFGRITQTVTVTETGTEHAVRIVVTEGPVQCRIGSTVGDDDYVEETRLERGEHSLAFTPTGNFTIQLANERQYNAWIDSCTIEAAGEMEFLTQYGEEDLVNLRWDQSGDVIYLSCLDEPGKIPNKHLQRIERRGTGRSWSLVDYLPEDGPFRTQNTSGLQMSSSGLAGDVSLSATQPIFRLEHSTNKSLFRIQSAGQQVSKSISSADDWTNSIRVAGSETAREFAIVITGTFSATVKLQFSFDNATWNDTGQTWVTPINTTYLDGQDGQIIYYRLGVDTGDYTSGTVVAALNYAGGSIMGIARVRNFTNSQLVGAQVLKPFGSTSLSKDWWEGEFSERRGYPTAVSIHEGRLWWAGNDKLFGSISDDFDSFDDEQVGDSGPITRSIGSGPIRTINWLLPMARLLIGTSDNSANVAAQRMDGNNPLSARSSNFDEPLTPTNFNIKTASSKGVFVDRTGQRLYELLYDIDVQDYKSVDLSVYTPDYNKVGIKQIAVQMKPDVRIHCIRNDGTVGVLVYDRLENVICWCEMDSPAAGGEIEDVAVLPGTVEDQVYYIVKRTINSVTQRHICKWAMESEAIGGTTNKMADSFVHYTGAATTTITGLAHLEGETVSVWADGAEVDDAVVASGQITLGTAATEVIVGLKYTAQFQSAKLASLQGIGLSERKKVNRIGFLAENLHYQGLQYGPDFDNLYDLPLVENSEITAADFIHEDYHEPNFPFGGEWEPDSRICLQAQSPRPCTLMAALVEMESVSQPKRSR